MDVSNEKNLDALLERLRPRFKYEIGIHNEYDNWSNVIDHCLLEAARAEVLAGLIGLSANARDNFIQAAALHDFYKKHEIEVIRAEVTKGGSGWRAYQVAERAATEALKKEGISTEVIELIGSIGSQPAVLEQIDAILKKDKRTEQDIARLAIHYVDDYTIDADWVVPAEKDSTGMVITDFYRRMLKNKSRPGYEKMNQEQRKSYQDNPLFSGKEPFQVGLELCRAIEEYFVGLIKENSGIVIERANLPEYIDTQLKI